MTNDIPRRLFSALARMQKITSFSKKYFSSTSSSRGPSSPLSSYMDSNTAPILIFHKSYCRVCKDLVERIEDGLSSGAMKEIAIDLAFSDRGDALREELRAKTGQKDVPFVFIGKEFIGTADVVNGLRIKNGKINDCELKPRLQALKIDVTGPFRA
jgi:hypothetical protein